MTALRVEVGDDRSRFAYGTRVVTVPVGSAALARSQLLSDPPAAAELTNAIGVVLDHLDDVLREVPEIAEADGVEVAGDDMSAIASVETGATVGGPLELPRDAAEDVFRTLATEARSARAHNPGLAAERLDTVVGGCCVVVALMRHLRLDTITVVAQITTDGDPGGEP